MKKTVIILTGILVFAFVIHYVVFRAETNCILVGLHGLNKQGNIYYSNETDIQKIKELQYIIEASEVRIDSFWGKRLGDPTYIYCKDDKMLFKYSGGVSIASSIMKMKGYIVVSENGLLIDVIAHEQSHIEIYKRIGFLKNLNFPIWLHEGIAMQVDYREDYSTKKLKEISKNLTELPNIEELKTNEQFHSGDYILHYATAKYHVGNLLKEKKMNDLLKEY